MPFLDVFPLGQRGRRDERRAERVGLPGEGGSEGAEAENGDATACGTRTVAGGLKRIETQKGLPYLPQPGPPEGGHHRLCVAFAFRGTVGQDLALQRAEVGRVVAVASSGLSLSHSR